MAHHHGSDVLQSLGEPTKALRQEIPEVFRGFAELHKAALADGALPRVTKELIALCVAIADHCDGCIASHARTLARAGATKEQVAEAIGVAILMTGGPGTVYGPRAYDAFLEFSESSEQS